MNESISTVPSQGQIISVHRSYRWSIYRRLQELNIPCTCPADGTLRVDIDRATALVLVHSTVRQYLFSRQEALDWLERCWQTQVVCNADR
ncbi:MAG: hypothetical protein J7641_02135 [Cyanobacteria bacterium SID2]|nr:hypothetical protein [Cyanobacteria bacterium SID2]MBP0002556.1 hypothetical protein [Cyanobacteria bacterium SBC]